MRAVIYSSFQEPLSVEHVDEPTPPPHGVVIKVKASGLCLSDWHGWMGHDKDITLPHVPGHELAGEIVEVGKDVTNFSIGERVTVPFVSGCGNCPQCDTGNHQICDNQFQPGFTHWGSFAEFVSIHYADTNLVQLPNEISFTTAASLGCRFATSFRGVVDQGRISHGQFIAVHGCGGVGLSAIMIAKAKGAGVIAIDISDEKLNHAQKLGADYIINASSTNVSETILELTKGGVHVGIDALGKDEVLMNSMRSLRKRGRHVQIGIMPPTETNSPIPTDLMIARELEIVGSHGMQSFRYDEMLNMIQNGELKPELLVSEELSLSDVVVELPSMNKSSSIGIKVITNFD